jgi:hypothetical protein
MAKERPEDEDVPDEAIQEGAAKPSPEARKRPPQDDADDRPRRPRRDDDDDRGPRRRRYEDDDDRRRPRGDSGMSSLIPYRNGMALAAYYCGVFALIPCVGVILGIISLILGFLGLNYAKQHPEAKGAGHAIAGIVLGAIVLLGHLALVVIFFLFRAGRG